MSGLRIILALLAGLTLAGEASALPKSCGASGLSRYVLDRQPDGKPTARERAVDASMTPQDLRCLSDQGHRHAMLELGRRYEAGDGVPVDLKQAEALYRKAATDIPAVRTIYRPPVTPGGSGGVLVINNPDASPGLLEAKARLSCISPRSTKATTCTANRGK